MDKKSYGELLRDPRWQRKRLEIMQRDDWSCQHCTATTRTLNVHHLYYSSFAEGPWDYHNDALLTLCERCHADGHLKTAQVDGIKKGLFISEQEKAVAIQRITQQLVDWRARNEASP